MSKALVLMMLTMLTLTGCVGTQAVTTIVQEGDKITTTLTGAAVQRDIVYADERKHRDSMSKAMFKDTGVVTEYELYTYTSPDGSFTFTSNRVKKVTAKAPHRYQQNIETRPPDHRGWNTLDKLIGVGEKGLIGYFINDTFKTNSDSSQQKFYGDYNPQTAAPYVIEPTIIQ